MITEAEIIDLEKRAIELRESVLTMLSYAGSGHTAGPLDMADIFAVLFFNILRHNPKSPDWIHRDRLILSNGHICPILYASLAHSGYMNINELLTLRKFGSRLQGHPHREFLPYVETSSGPLGSGLSQAIGMALADRIDSKINDSWVQKYFYCLMGDGEMNEGQVWEALLLLAKEKLGNVIVVIDRNRIQIDGNTEDVMPLDDLKDKLEAFNFDVKEINGHDIREICETFNSIKNLNQETTKRKPTVVIANTIAGKGYKEIEGDYKWHGKPVNKDEREQAIRELNVIYNSLY